MHGGHGNPPVIPALDGKDKRSSRVSWLVRQPTPVTTVFKRPFLKEYCGIVMGDDS